jgi:hypothetical protein
MPLVRIWKRRYRKLEAEQKVEFSIEADLKGLQAANVVTPASGMALLGWLTACLIIC